MTTPFEVQDQGLRVTYMASAMVDCFGFRAARVADSQRLLSVGDIARTWEDIRTHITSLLPEIAFDV